MKLFALLVITASLASAQWYNPFTWWGRVTAIGEPECVVGGKIADRDDTRHRGPVCDPWELNVPTVLAAHITRKQQENVKNLEAFTAARKAAAFPPTVAVWENDIIGTSPMSALDLTTIEQAERYKARLVTLAGIIGIPCRLALYQRDRDLRGGRPNYKGDPRREYYIQREDGDNHSRDGLLAAVLLLAYMSDPEETADARFTAGIRNVCTVPSERRR